jgi:hypothetical protein
MNLQTNSRLQRHEENLWSVLLHSIMTNATELISRLEELSRCMALPFSSSAGEVHTACRALAATAEAEGPEIAAAGLDLATAIEGVSDGTANLRVHLRLQTLMARIQMAAESSHAGRIWAAGQNLAELLLVVGKFLDDAPEPRWAEEFPPAVCGLEAVRLEMRNLVSLLGRPTPTDRFGLEEIDQALLYATQLIEPAPEVPLFQYLASASKHLVRDTHAAWISSHLSEGESAAPTEVYTWYWNETLGEAALDEAKVGESAATVSAFAKAMGLDEVVDYLDDPDQVTYYGLYNILPTAPTRWNLEDASIASRHLHRGLAHWYFRPLKASLAPLDVIMGVVRTRRPYYYHRMLAHALMQTVCVQRALPAGMMTDVIVGKLAAFCDLMLDGYHQRCRYLPVLKTPQGWVEYLNALVTLHFPDGQGGALCGLSGSGPSIYAALARVLYGRPN